MPSVSATDWTAHNAGSAHGPRPGDRPLYTQGTQLPQSLADTLSIDVREVSDGDHLRRASMERAEHIATLPPTGRFDPTPGEAPEIPQKGAEDKRRRSHKKHGTLPRLCVGEAWRPLFFDILPAHRGRLWLAVSRPCDGAARRRVSNRRTGVGLRRMPVRVSSITTASLMGWGRMLPSMRFKSGPPGASRALGAMEGEVFEGFPTACLIQLQI